MKRHLHWDGWEFPKGGVDRGEGKIISAFREIKEETGLDIEISKFLCEWDLNLKDQGIHLIGKTYLCLTPLDLVTLSSEHYSFVWVKYDHIKKFNLPKWLKISFKKIYH